MQWFNPRRKVVCLPFGWRCVWIGIALCMAVWPSLGLGQDDDPSRSALEDSIFYDDRVTGRSGEALGALWRAGYVTGPGIGRNDGIAPVEVMPYFFLEDGMLFGDLRGFRSDRDGWGGNLGLGYRHYVRQWDRIFGVNAFYDYDNTSGELFRQVGFGFETLGKRWDSRLNTYFPVSNEQALLNRRFLQSSIRFSGNQILYDQILTFGTQLRGLDHEVGVPLPGRFAEGHDVRLFAGWYHFDGPRVPNTTGWKGRLQGELTPNVAMALEVTNDTVFDTNVVFSVALQYGGFREDTNRPKSQFSRMTTPVQRQYTAVVSRTDVLETGIVARKPDGRPYLVEHVANSPTDPNLGPFLGTAENPFLTIAQAQANFFTNPPFDVPVSPYAGDIIFVHTNSQYNATNIVLEPNVRVLGEADGVVHQINLPPFGLVNLPRVNDNPGLAVPELRPIFLNTTGDGVVLASNAEFSGFRIGLDTDPTSGPSGNGIVGDSVNNTLVRLVDINFAGADGVRLNNVNTVAFDQTHIFNAANVGLHVIGGSPNITFEGDGDATTPDIEYDLATPPGGNAVQIENTLGGLVDLFGATPSAINYNNAGGIFINNSRGAASFGDVRITNTDTGVDGIRVLASSGIYVFGRPVFMDNPDGQGIDIFNLGTTGRVNFNDSVTINNRSVEGVLLDSNAGDVRFNNSLSIVTNGAAPFQAALSYQSSSGDATFQNITLTGGQFRLIPDPIDPVNNPPIPVDGIGISIGNATAGVPNNTGTFTVTGVTTITDFGGISLDIRDDDSNVSFGTLAIDDRGDTGISIIGETGSVIFRGITSVGNTSDAANNVTLSSNDTGVVIDSNTGDIGFGTLTITNSLGNLNNTVAGMSITDNPSQITIQQLNIQSTFGEALFAFNVGDTAANPLTGGLFVNSGTLNSVFDSAINVEQSVVSMNFTSVTAIQSFDEGIRMVDNTAGSTGVSLSINPGNDIVGNGGRIVQSSNQGIFAQNTGPIAIRAMDFVQNGIFGVVDGIFTTNNQAALLDVRTATTLTVQSSSIVQSGASGIHTLNTPFVSIVNTRFLQNDVAAGSPELLIEGGLILPDGADADTLADPYVVRLDQLNVTENLVDGILVRTLPLGFGAALDLELTNSTVFLNPTVGGPSAVNIAWSGPESLLIDNNQITFLGIFSEGVTVTNNFTNDLDPNTPDLSLVTLTDNVLQGPGDANTGMAISMQGPSSVLVARNTFTLGGFVDNAIVFTYGANTNTNLEDNVVDAAGDQSRGFVFQSISAPALVTMNGNTLTFSNNDGFLDERGIEFLSTVGTINFNGTVNNVVTIDNLNGIGFPWFIFPNNGSANGSVIVNSTPQP